MIDPYKAKTLTNLKKAQGQIDHIIKMIEEKNSYCIDIATQTSAAIGLLKKVKENILESHLTTCGAENLSDASPQKEAFIKELVRTFTITNK